jgi:hypothetical protein
MLINCRVDADQSDGAGNVTLLGCCAVLRVIRVHRRTHRWIDVLCAKPFHQSRRCQEITRDPQVNAAPF